MIYLNDRTGLQQFRIPATGLATADGTAVLNIYSTISGEQIASIDVEIVVGEAYHTSISALPDTLQGEYRYELLLDDSTIGEGLLVVGEPTRITPAGSGVETITIKQYGE